MNSEMSRLTPYLRGHSIMNQEIRNIGRMFHWFVHTTMSLPEQRL